MARFEKYKNNDDPWTVGNLMKCITTQVISNRLTPHQHQNQMIIESLTTIKDIIIVNQLLHSLTAKDKGTAFTIKTITGVININKF